MTELKKSQNSQKTPELLLPAGTLNKLKTAYLYGADAVYAGAAGFSMRPDQASFTADALREGYELARTMGKKLYVGINSMLYDEDLQQLDQWLGETADIDFDAIILADAGAIELVKKRRSDVEIHISTQMATANAASANFWASAGASRVILARECSLAQAAKIVSAAKAPIEIFVHGAMCTAVSGRCLLSAHLSGKSGSRGECKHVCRWDWQLVESKRPGMAMPVFQTDKETIFLGSRDLCLIEHLPQVVGTGVASLKIEGRMKGESYVAVVTNVYREALDMLAKDGERWQCKQEWLDALDTVPHQPYSTGFAFGYPVESPADLQTDHRVPGNKEIVAIVEKHLVGKVYQLDSKRPFSVGDSIEYIAPGQPGGHVEILEITTLEGYRHDKPSHVGLSYRVKLSKPLPDYSMLRQNVVSVKKEKY